jgi:hypothetical protein
MSGQLSGRYPGMSGRYPGVSRRYPGCPGIVRAPCPGCSSGHYPGIPYPGTRPARPRVPAEGQLDAPPPCIFLASLHSTIAGSGPPSLSSPISEENPDPGLGSNLDLRSRSEFASNPVLRSRSEFDIESSPQVQGRAESDFGEKPRSRTGVKSGSQIQV